jgi:hypothetical protein
MEEKGMKDDDKSSRWCGGGGEGCVEGARS